MKLKKVLPKCMSILALSGIFVFGTFNSTASAHLVTAIGSEGEHYSVDALNHAGKAHVNYTISSNVDNMYKSYILDGAKKWYSTGIMNFWYEPPGATGTFLKYSDPNTSTVAAFYDYKSSYYHLYSWKIKLNSSIMSGRSYSANTTTIAHELGHATGLNDLYADYNKNVLMYGYSSRTATEPTKSDLLGASRANW